MAGKAERKKGGAVAKLKNSVKGALKSVIKWIGYKWVLPVYYKWQGRKAIDEKLVVFADFRDRKMPDNFLSIYKMCEEYGYRCVVLSGRPFGNLVPIWTRRKEKLKFQFDFIRLYAQCRAVFLVEYFPLAYIVKPRKGTDVVQLWHGCGMMKKIGYSAQGANWGSSEKELKRYPMHTTYTLASASSARVKEDVFVDAFRCDPNIIQPLGVPRTDIYFEEAFRKSARKKVRALFPGIGDRRIILYAPTFRGKSIRTSYIKNDLDYSLLNERLSQKYAIITKFHPMMAKGGLPEAERLTNLGFVYDGTLSLGAEEALCAADILITDYSSIMFEYLLLERPLISYIFDIDTYIADRGLYAPYEQLAPGPYVKTTKELLEKIETVDEWFDLERIRQYRQEFMGACDGHSTTRIFRTVFRECTAQPKGMLNQSAISGK